LGLSALACVLAGLSLSKGTPPSSGTVAAARPEDARAPATADELAKLRAELERLAAAVRDDSSMRDAAERNPVEAKVPIEVAQRLSALEETLASLQRQAKERELRAQPAPGAVGGAKDLQRAATNPNATEQEKLAALKALRGQNIDGQDARSHDVVVAMLDLAERSLDENTRDGVYRDLHGVNDASLRDSMLRALANDPSAKVRQRAARDIDTYLSDALVQSALQRAGDQDSDLGVRGQALKTLAGQH